MFAKMTGAITKWTMFPLIRKVANTARLNVPDDTIVYKLEKFHFDIFKSKVPSKTLSR